MTMLNTLSALAPLAIASAMLLGLSGCAGQIAGGQPQVPARCETVGTLHREDVDATAALTAAGSFTPPSGAAIADVPAFCRVQARLRPSADSDIRVELWLPERGWNGRFLGLGNGGYAGALNYPALAAGLKRGYAVAHTDMGTAPTNPADAGEALIGHPDKWLDWGHRSTHLMTMLSKSVVQAYYQKPASKSYFVGCSTGGGQGLHEAQRYPYDYDGIVAGAPGHNRVATHQNVLWAFAATQRDQASYIPRETFDALAASARKSCDGADGLVDGLISRPDLCKPDLSILTPPQAEAMRKLYAGPTNLATGERIFPGAMPGSEANMVQAAPPPNQRSPYDGIFKWVFGADWDWRTFDFGADADRMKALLSDKLDATNPDLSAFRQRGGKIVAFHGLADALVPPGETALYVDAVKSGLGETDSFLRLFYVAGMGHCRGGDAPNMLGNDLQSNSPYPGDPERDALGAVQAWVEQGRVPQKLIATQFEGNTVDGAKVRDRPLCVYPQVARYLGSGDPNAASSFRCESP
jgi:feruloyl esterase